MNLFAGVYQKKFKIFGLKDAETGEVISAYDDGNLVSFDASAVPSMGYKTYIALLQPIQTESTLILDEQPHPRKPLSQAEI